MCIRDRARRRERLGSEVGMLQGVVGELRGHVRDLTERLLAQVDDVESVMASTIPQEFREAEPVQEVVEEEFETVYEADDSDQSEEGYGQSPEESDERSDERSDELDAVSYTHLTLPTIL